MVKRYLIAICFTLSACLAQSQTPAQDSIPPVTDADLAMDDSLDYDELLNELGLFLDSILAPRSYFLANLSVNSGYFNFTDRSNTRIHIERKTIWSPALGYYHKGGLGISVTGNIINDGNQSNLYQYAVSPSYDFLKDRKLVTGVAYTRYFTKDRLNFYTSPLQNEVYGYFLWRKSWLQPGITANYGWGSRSDYQQRKIIYADLVADNLPDRPRPGNLIDWDTATIIEKNTESIVDFTVTGSLRHDFYWLNLFSDKDYIKFTPLLSLLAGTQRFGYNQTTVTSGGGRRINFAYNSGTKNISLEDKFKLLSLSLYLRAEYTVGKFFFQPQIVADYYLPATRDNLSTMFSVNVGFML